MAYAKFTLSEILEKHNLRTDRTQDLFPDVVPVPPSDALKLTLEWSVPLAQQVGSEKARSELVISPILTEIYRLLRPDIGYFSGIEFNVDESRGFAGYCDYIFTRSAEQSVIASPVVCIVEAKKEDLKPGMGQCIAELMAARIFNERQGNEITEIYGAVTTGTNWQFLKLDDQIVYVDRLERFLNGAEIILGILRQIVSGETKAV